MSFKSKLSQFNHKRHQMRENLKHKPVVFVLFRSAVIGIGFFLMFLGMVMLITPGPGMLALLAGLSLLATELPWAHRLIRRIRLYWNRFRLHFWRGRIRKNFPANM